MFERTPPTRVLAGDGLRVSGQSNPFRIYDVSSDGRRFLVLKSAQTPQQTASVPTMVVITNWFEELKRRVPGK